eukprot:13044234-Heterocapsa_arctica.AAC.1
MHVLPKLASLRRIRAGQMIRNEWTREASRVHKEDGGLAHDLCLSPAPSNSLRPSRARLVPAGVLRQPLQSQPTCYMLYRIMYDL